MFVFNRVRRDISWDGCGVQELRESQNELTHTRVTVVVQYSVCWTASLCTTLRWPRGQICLRQETAHRLPRDPTWDLQSGTASFTSLVVSMVSCPPHFRLLPRIFVLCACV